MHLNQRSEAPTLNRIVLARNFITHDLLYLPQALPYPVLETHYEQHLSEHANSNMNIFSSRNAPFNPIRLANTSLHTPGPLSYATRYRPTCPIVLLADDGSRRLHGSRPLYNFQFASLSTILGSMVPGEGGLRSWFARMASHARTRISNLTERNAPGWSMSVTRQKSKSQPQPRELRGGHQARSGGGVDDRKKYLLPVLMVRWPRV